MEKQSHVGNTTVHSAFMGSTSCDQCGLDPATIVAGEAIGLVQEPPSAAKHVRPAATRRSAGPRKPTRAELEAKVRELGAKVRELEAETSGSAAPRLRQRVSDLDCTRSRAGARLFRWAPA